MKLPLTSPPEKFAVVFPAYTVRSRRNFLLKTKRRYFEALTWTEKENTSVEKTFKIQIPIALRKQLVDDWEFVNQQHKLVKLPRSPTVDEVLAKYLEYRSKKDGM